ncbi:hypothetical protein [Salinibacter grassmerensis]|uniref:hypothetical protein n=1 Tax=Salinibacter grassmerensis TaxID=3040353 RepID=UPI0021E8D6BF|nr:hypothetical protein [Salinibacter grassmerensis]
MDNRNVNNEDTAPTDMASVTRPAEHVASAPPTRQVLRAVLGGVLGGGVFAIIQHLSPGFLTDPALVRWVFLHAVLGGAMVSAWQATTWWAAARFSLSRHGVALVSSLTAGVLVGTAALLVATLKQGTGAGGLLLLQLPWKDALGGFVGGVVGGGMWKLLSPDLHG